MKSLLFAALLLLLAQGSAFAQGWIKVEGLNKLNANDAIHTLCADSGGILYAAGEFRDSTCVARGEKFVAKWDGISWTKLGSCTAPLYINPSTYDGFIISSLCVDSHHNVYAAGVLGDSSGYFHVSKWDGTKWSVLGTGVNALDANHAIYCMCIDKYDNIYVAGAFTNADGDYYVAKWDGYSWNELGTGSHSLSANSWIKSICTDTNGYIYVGGQFTEGVGFGLRTYVAKWDGVKWKKVGSGPSFYSFGTIDALCSDSKGNLYAGGGFPDADGNAYVAKWDGANWNMLGSSFKIPGGYSHIQSICCDSKNNIFATGLIRDVDGYCYVAVWNGTTWDNLGGSNPLKANGEPLTMCADGGTGIYTAGYFFDTLPCCKFNYYVSKYNTDH